MSQGLVWEGWNDTQSPTWMSHRKLVNGWYKWVITPFIYWVITHLQTIYKIPGTSKYAIISACINIRRVHRCSDRYSGQSLVNELNSDQVHISDALQVTNHCWVLLWFPGHLGAMKQTKKGITRDQSVVMCQESFRSHPCFQIWFAMSSWDLGSLKILELPEFFSGIILYMFAHLSTTYVMRFSKCCPVCWPSLLVKFFWEVGNFVGENTHSHLFHRQMFQGPFGHWTLEKQHWDDTLMTRVFFVMSPSRLVSTNSEAGILLFFFPTWIHLMFFFILTSLT